MIILKVAVGNREEAFVECDLSAGFNIISSDDNNKGKTIVIQSMMYALGNEPTFPTSFNYQKYYYYVEFEVFDKLYKICRHGNSFVLKHADMLMVFENVSELKRYWDKNIFGLPYILKNQLIKIVDPVLFVQLFFVGQDKKDASNIAHHGLYNKQDFIEMLFSIAGLGAIQLTPEDTDAIKKEITSLGDERKLLLRQHKILKSKKISVAFLTQSSDRHAFEEKISSMERTKDKITELRKARNTTLTRKTRWETTIKELRSLNRAINCGELRCMDCNSTNISFGMGNDQRTSYIFDVSTPEMRTDIIESIQQKINSYDEEIERLSVAIAAEQEKLKELMDDDDISLESIVAYKKDIFSAADAEKRLAEIEAEISHLNDQLRTQEVAVQSARVQRERLVSAIIDKMNELYGIIDPYGNIKYSNLFTLRNEVYSGSEATVFHLIKLLAIQSVIQHNYPIVIDSFRAEDLSTVKEDAVLSICRKISNQIIFTTTLKDEEAGKYDKLKSVHHIDYQKHIPSQLLTAGYVDEFGKLLAPLAIQF